MKIKFCISSHISFYEKTYIKLITSFKNIGIPSEDIYFFIGGRESYTQIPEENRINVFEVPHNSIDFTGLVSVAELDLKADYWFLLHDTTVLGSEFYKKLINFPINGEEAIPLTYDVSMNMGLYKQQYIYSIKNELTTTFKNTDYSEKSTQGFKQMLIDKEDYFISNFKNKVLNPIPREVTNGGDFYGTGVNRIIEFYSSIDLYKIKANWFVKEKYEITP